MKVAIVCDWLTGIGGAERVVLQLHKMFPSAPIYTSQYDPKAISWFKDADVRTTFLQKLPKGLRKFLPVLRAWSFSHLDLSKYDLVISSSGAEAKFVKVPHGVHVSYIHAPTHYYWSRYEQYLKQPGFGAFNWLARIGLKILAAPMRRWDYKSALRPNYLIANSIHTKKMIKKYYGRESVVIHPPVDLKRFDIKTESKRQGFVTAGRQTPYKKIDLAVEACSQLNLPLTVIGNGPDHARLVKIAGANVRFVTDANDLDVPRYFAEAEAFIFPGLDDFGIVAVEAMAAGTPVIAYKDGGALDYINEHSGLFFNEQTVGSLKEILRQFDTHKYSAGDIKKAASAYSEDNFEKNLRKCILSVLK